MHLSGRKRIGERRPTGALEIICEESDVNVLGKRSRHLQQLDRCALYLFIQL